MDEATRQNKLISASILTLIALGVWAAAFVLAIGGAANVVSAVTIMVYVVAILDGLILAIAFA